MTRSSFSIVFFGTPEFAATSLRALLDSPWRLAAVVTQPDRRRGRGRVLTPGPVKELATRAGLTVLQPENPSCEGFPARLRGLGADLFVVVAYGRILSQEILDAPGRDILNVHASLLPRWRGAAPIQHAILAGDRETGVSIQRVVRRLDAGPVFSQRRAEIGVSETAGELTGRLAEMGASLLVETLEQLARETLEPQPQDETGVTRAPSLVKADGRVDFTQPAERIERLVRAMTPWPGAQAVLSHGGKRHAMRISRCDTAASEGETGRRRPGEAWVADGGLRVRTGRGDVVVLELQPSGKRAMTAAEFLRGRQAGAEMRFLPHEQTTVRKQQQK